VSPDLVCRLARCTIGEERAVRRYRVPCAGASDIDAARLVHVDLLDLDDLALRVEATRVLGALGEADRIAHEPDWVGGRLSAIDAEHQRRTGMAAA
jgi:hypothetical protein